MTNNVFGQQPLRYLALGDSYTIGESLPPTDNFPSQVQAILAKQGVIIDEITIIAKTGWTTDELSQAIDAAQPANDYDFVSLLVGVNNQYRGRSAAEYAGEFEALLHRAIGFAGGRRERVVVLSIPDWGVTPYAEGRDRLAIARAIDAYNKVNRDISRKHDIRYIDITPGTRKASSDPVLVAEDGLHPSSITYHEWAEAVAAWITKMLK